MAVTLVQNRQGDKKERVTTLASNRHTPMQPQRPAREPATAGRMVVTVQPLITSTLEPFVAAFEIKSIT
jgi:hypothetical protein